MERDENDPSMSDEEVMAQMEPFCSAFAALIHLDVRRFEHDA